MWILSNPIIITDENGLLVFVRCFRTDCTVLIRIILRRLGASALVSTRSGLHENGKDTVMEQLRFAERGDAFHVAHVVRANLTEEFLYVQHHLAASP